MTTDIEDTSAIDTVEQDIGVGPKQQHQYWATELKISARNLDPWLKDAAKMNKKFRSEKQSQGGETTQKMNLLWSNVSTLQPALFQKMPAPIVERRFRQKSPVARTVAEVLEKALKFTVDECDAETEFKGVRDDYLLAGRGVPKVVYSAEIDKGFMPTDEELAAAIAQGIEAPEPIPPSILGQTVEIEHIPYVDFRTSNEARWKKTRWVAFRVRMNRSRLKARFPDKAQKVTLGKSRCHESDDVDGIEQMFQEAEVWEIWDKENKKVVWFSEGYTDGLLDEADDPYGLKGFFPCPRPLQVITTSTDGTPVPEYNMYEDQAAEVNRLTDRIYKIANQIRAVGAYSGQDSSQLEKMLSSEDGTLVSFSSFSMMDGKGKLSDMIEWAPIQHLVNTLNSLLQARQTIKQDLYEVTGLSDILRGSSNAGDSATAQRIKGQFATLRLDERKREVARMIQETVSICGEMIAEHFELEILAAISDMELPISDAEIQEMGMAAQMAMQEAQATQNEAQAAAAKEELARLETLVSWEQVMATLRDDYRRSFSVRVETEDTTEVDRQADRQQRIEFLTAFVQLLQAMNAIVAGGALPYDVAKQIIMFSVRGFSAARELEDVLEDLQAPVAQDDGPSAEEVKMQIEQMGNEVKVLLQKMQNEHEAREASLDRDLEVLKLKVSDGQEAEKLALQGASKAADIQIAKQSKGNNNATSE